MPALHALAHVCCYSQPFATSLHPQQQECKQLSNLVLLLEDVHAEITKGPSMPCRHADCEGTAWRIITIGLSVHHYRLQACASLQDAAAHLPDHCLPVSAVYTLVWMASDMLLYSCLTIANLSLLSLQWSGWLLIRFSLKGHPMCRSLRFGLRHPVHCLSHHSSDGVGLGAMYRNQNMNVTARTVSLPVTEMFGFLHVASSPSLT